jgi:DNA-binding transcriptional MerR regulator
MKDSNLISIKEFSELTGINQSRLRHYDEVGLFKPIKRGGNGYRYYSPLQTIMVNCVNVLRSVGVPIKQMNDYLRRKTPERVLRLLRNQELELNLELFRLQQAYAVVHTYAQMIEEGLAAGGRAVSCGRMDALAIEIGPENNFSAGRFNESYFAFLKEMRARNIDPACPTGGMYKSISAFAESPGRPDYFFARTPLGRDVKPAGEYLIGCGRGYYGNLGNLPQRMTLYAQENGLVCHGPVYECYLHDELCVEDPEQYLIRACVQVKRRKGPRHD